MQLYVVLYLLYGENADLVLLYFAHVFLYTPFLNITEEFAKQTYLLKLHESEIAKQCGHIMHKLAVHPTLATRIGTLLSQHITIIKNCCFKSMRIDWERVNVTLLYNDHPIRLPTVGSVSMWSSSDLESIESTEQYTVHILGRVLDQLYEIPMSVEATVGVIGGGEYVQYEETADVPFQLKSSPPR